MADRYAAALDMAEWADGLGCARITVSEHHGSADGYLPSPVQMLAAMAARTKQVRFLVAALIAPFHDPLRLAGPNRVVALAEDPDEGWERMAPFFLHETNAYGEWQDQDDVAAPFRTAEGMAELRRGDQYRVLTPAQFVTELKAAPTPFTQFHPLCGGMPMDLAWSSLRLFEREVLPAFG
jgi:hypothetical protein